MSHVSTSTVTSIAPKLVSFFGFKPLQDASAICREECATTSKVTRRSVPANYRASTPVSRKNGQSSRCDEWAAVYKVPRNESCFLSEWLKVRTSPCSRGDRFVIRNTHDEPVCSGGASWLKVAKAKGHVV